jgi:hypothetical protein
MGTIDQDHLVFEEQGVVLRINRKGERKCLDGREVIESIEECPLIEGGPLKGRVPCGDTAPPTDRERRLDSDNELRKERLRHHRWVSLDDESGVLHQWI